MESYFRDGERFMEIDADRTALVIIDPQNDFLSEGGVVWDLVGEGVVQNDVVNRLKKLIAAAKSAGIDVVYVPHYYDKEYTAWKNNNFIDTMMFERRMFESGKWGAEFHPDLVPDDDTILCAPHKNLSGFHTSDVDIQLRKRGIDTILLADMPARRMVSNLTFETPRNEATQS
jgi:nicotinamidase-related amidase